MTTLTGHPTLTPRICEQARLTRDARFDGLFFTAVRSTGDSNLGKLTNLYTASTLALDPNTGKTIRMFECLCGQRSWSEDR